MIANNDLERLIETAREHGLIVRTKRDTSDSPITGVQIRARRGGIGSDWMPPIQAAERLRAFIAETTTCGGCGKPLLPENAWMCDGCPCNSPRGVNHVIVPTSICTCTECDPAQTGAPRKEPELVERFYQATGELMVKAKDYDALKQRFDELKERLDATECTLEDEEAAHDETLRMLEIAKQN